MPAPHTDTPLVSVITPVYNEEDHIRDTIKSVKNQQYDRVEHIILDDGSTDDTAAILSEYASQDHIQLVSKENEGQAATVNQGFEMVNGEYVIWLNGDDVLFDVDSISQIVKFFERNSSVDIASANRAIINEQNQLQSIRIPFQNFSKERLHRSCYSAFIFFRSHVVAQHQLDESYDYALDYEYYLRLADAGFNFGYINSVILGYRRHDDTKSVENADEMWKEGKKVRHKYGQTTGIKFRVKLFLDYVYLTRNQTKAVRYLLKYRNTNSVSFDIEIPPIHEILYSQAMSALPTV